MPVKLTETAIKAALAQAALTKQRRDLADAFLPGLRLRLTPAGSASWVLACRDREGAMRRFPLGRYPDMGIAAARDAARLTHTKVKREGADPVKEARTRRRMAAEAKAGIGTLDALLDAYGAAGGAKRKSWPEAKRRIQHVFAKLLKRRAEHLTLGELQAVVDDHPAEYSAAAAVRYLRPVLKWGAHPGRALVPAELVELHAPAVVRRRDRVLSEPELMALLPVLRQRGDAYARVLLALLYTAARLDEVASARWRDVDDAAATLTIPTPKNTRPDNPKPPHVVPLSHQARALLGERGKADALIFATPGGEKLSNWDRTTKAIMQAASVTGWHRHDLRRTASTMIGHLGVDPHVIEAALGHAAIHSQLASVYNQARYLPQVAEALQRLADALDAIEKKGEKS